MTPDQCWVIAHRGHSTAATENSVPALEHAIAAGADAVECDVRLSADGVAMVSHDADLNRLAGSELAVATLSADELEAHARTAGASLPRLSSLMHAARGPVPLVLDVKLRDPMVIEHIAQAAAETGFEPTSLVLGLREAALIPICQDRLPDAGHLALHGEQYPLGAFLDAGVKLVRLWEAKVDPNTVSELRARGCRIWVTTGGPGTGRAVGDTTPEALATMVSAGVDGVLVNDPQLGRTAVDRV